MNFVQYAALLAQIRDLLLAVGDQRWGPRLHTWLTQLDANSLRSDASVLEHVRRTHDSLMGMGSIGDVVISAESGHDVSSLGITFEGANDKLTGLAEQLFDLTERLLAESRS